MYGYAKSNLKKKRTSRVQLFRSCNSLQYLSVCTLYSHLPLFCCCKCLTISLLLATLNIYYFIYSFLIIFIRGLMSFIRLKVISCPWILFTFFFFFFFLKLLLVPTVETLIGFYLKASKRKNIYYILIL